MATGKKFSERETLHQLYVTLVEEWALTAGDLADMTGLSVSRVNVLLKKLARARLIDGTHVNGPGSPTTTRRTTIRRAS
jgi:DNA-binding transcriptional regulator GbsR (MarR family)